METVPVDVGRFYERLLSALSFILQMEERGPRAGVAGNGLRVAEARFGKGAV